MGCACRQKKKKNLVYVKDLATKFSLGTKQDVQIYTLILQPIGKIYDFEPINENRKEIIEYIRYKTLQK